jgi:hypothetical protein
VWGGGGVGWGGWGQERGCGEGAGQGGGGRWGGGRRESAVVLVPAALHRSTTTPVTLPLQVLSSGMDARQCYYFSKFFMEDLMHRQAGHYWEMVKQLLAQAQHQEDEQLLGNPFVQLQALLQHGPED